MSRKLTKIEVINKAHEVHGYKYIYDKMDYINNKTKVCIGCKIHGDFWQTPHDHLSGRGCSKCAILYKGINRRRTLGSFIERAKEVHGGKYIYNENKINYVNGRTKACFTCPKHGDFWQTPDSHLQGHGCPKCSAEKASVFMSLTFEEFKNKGEKLHNGKYIYNDSNYVNYDTPIRITCPKHGDFWQTPDSHLQGKGCPKCARITSKAEDDISDFIAQECHLMLTRRDRKLLSEKLECDILVPSHKLAIEFDGIVWHSEKFGKDKGYHLHKTELAESKGYHLIHIFEDEWLEHKDIVLNKIRHVLGCDTDKPVIGARKCVIKTLSKPLTKEFLTTYHLQGFSPSTALYGAYFGDVLIGVMTFKKEKQGIWNFNRFATNTDYRLPGLASKMFKQFVKDYNPTEVKAFLDRRWSHCDCNLYDKMAFKLEETLIPDYSYSDKSKGKRLPKSKFTKQILAKKYNLSLTMTEKEMAEQLGFYRIWDCGLYKYVWKPLT